MTIYTTNSEINRTIVKKPSNNFLTIECPLATRRLIVQSIVPNPTGTIPSGVVKKIYDLDLFNEISTTATTTAGATVLADKMSATSLLRLNEKFAGTPGSITVASGDITYVNSGIKLPVGSALLFSDFSSDEELANSLENKIVFITAEKSAGNFAIGGIKTAGATNTGTYNVKIISGITGGNFYYDSAQNIYGASRSGTTNEWDIIINSPLLTRVDDQRPYGSLQVNAGSDILKDPTKAASFEIVELKSATGFVTVKDPKNLLKVVVSDNLIKGSGSYNFQIGNSTIEQPSYPASLNKNIFLINTVDFVSAGESLIVDTEQLCGALDVVTD